MSTLMIPVDVMKTGLLAGIMIDPNSQNALCEEPQRIPYTRVNTLTIALPLFGVIGVPYKPIPALEPNEPGQVVDLWKFVDKEEESWLKLLSRSRKKLADENEL
jgi:hypothetical protein